MYAQAEELRNPALAGRPLAVTQKYLIVTCNYPARARGVTKLMATAEGRKLCPELATVRRRARCSLLFTAQGPVGATAHPATSSPAMNNLLT